MTFAIAEADPSPRPQGLHLVTTASSTFIDQSTAGSGQVGPEATGFINGSPFAPNTPYDFFSSAPEVPGVAGIGDLRSRATYGFRSFDVSITGGLGYVRGSTTNASYWGENLFPTLNPHLGSQTLPYAIVFPTHAGQDDGTGVRASLLSGSLLTADGNLAIRGGWFDLAQTDRFVFAQPPLTNVNPAIAYAPAESLANDTPGADMWQPDATALPLQGVDIVGKHGIASLELTNAALPSLPGDSVRMTMGSLVVDHGEGTRFSGQLVHVTNAGEPFTITLPFGANPQFTNTSQGIFPTSTLSGQRETIAGVRAAFHLVPSAAIDGVAEIGRSWYKADPVSLQGSEKPGGYYHFGVTKTRGRATASVDYYRMEPRYATAILPYGVAENQWSPAFSWPGVWLKSNYQLVDNTVLGVNRQGYRLRYFVDKGPLEVRVEYVDLRQIEEQTTQSALQDGFADGYFLPQLPGAATFGRQKHYGFWTAWHPRFGDITLDVVDDMLYRPFVPAHPEDAVSYEVPQAVLTYARHISPAMIATTGLGRYAITGTFSAPIDAAQRLFFLGLEMRQTPKASLLASFRRTAVAGMPTLPGSSVSPDFTGSLFVLEQRYQL